MEIKNTRNLNPGAALKIEAKETKQAKNASSFTLRVTDGKVTAKEISHMLTLARVSTAYKNNAAKYQFKLKSDSNGQYLTLKQQGAWSNFKGLLGIGHKAREQERAAAKNLINQSLSSRELPSKTYNVDKYDERLPLSKSQNYQLSMMNTSLLSPVARFELDAVGISKQAASTQQNQRQDSEEITFSKLAGEQAYVSDDVEANRPSYQAYDPNEDNAQSAPAVPQQPLNAAPAHSSLMRNTEQIEDPHQTNNSLFNPSEDGEMLHNPSFVEGQEPGREDFNQFMFGLMLKQNYE